MTIDIDLFWLIASLAGGFFGAAIGANFAFGMTGITALIGLATLAGSGNSFVLDYVAFGPFTGPHVAFAGGVGAAAYAAWRKYESWNAKDVTTPLARLARPDVLIVGALFGAGGYLVQRCVLAIPWFGDHTDSVAFTVMISGIVARLCFGRRSLFDWHKDASWSPREGAAWVRTQERPGDLLGYGLFFGILGAGASIVLLEKSPQIAAAHQPQAFGFAISAILILLLSLGAPMPVTHHMTITGGVAAVQFTLVAGFSPVPALLIGALFGLVGALLGEVAARGMYNRGSTHIDPPAIAIWSTTTLAIVAASLFG